MENSKHIFVQIDTDGIIREKEVLKALKKADDKKGIFEIIRGYTTIYDQGTMVMGYPIKTFTIDILPGQEVYFTILPAKLYSHHKLYFDGFECTTEIGLRIPDLSSQHELSFKVTASDNVNGTESTEFCLSAVLEYEGEDSIVLLIDPVIQVVQD